MANARRALIVLACGVGATVGAALADWPTGYLVLMAVATMAAAACGLWVRGRA